jgi:hypothetical protein
MKRSNVQSLLDARELLDYSSSKAQRLLSSHSCLVEGLRLVSVLEDHSGCVNTIEWNAAGTELLTSGDDLKVDVWDSADWSLKGSYRTGLFANGFFCFCLCCFLRAHQQCFLCEICASSRQFLCHCGGRWRRALDRFGETRRQVASSKSRG